MIEINSNEIRSLRKVRGLTQDDVANHLQISRVTYNTRERRNEFKDCELMALDKLFKETECVKRPPRTKSIVKSDSDELIKELRERVAKLEELLDKSLNLVQTLITK